MAQSTGYAIAVGTITGLNEVIFAPIAGQGVHFNWRIIPATLVFALALTGIEQLSPELAKGIGVIALVTVLFARVGNAPAPAENLAQILGYTKINTGKTGA